MNGHRSDVAGPERRGLTQLARLVPFCLSRGGLALARCTSTGIVEANTEAGFRFL